MTIEYDLYQLLTDRNVSALDVLPKLLFALDKVDSDALLRILRTYAGKTRTLSIEQLAQLEERLVNCGLPSSQIQRILHITRVAYWAPEDAATATSPIYGESLLWLISNDPSDRFLYTPYCLPASGSTCEMITTKWKSILPNFPSNASVLRNAAYFLVDREKEVALQLYLSCALLDPDDSEYEYRINYLKGCG